MLSLIKNEYGIKDSRNIYVNELIKFNHKDKFVFVKIIIDQDYHNSTKYIINTIEAILQSVAQIQIQFSHITTQMLYFIEIITSKYELMSV